MLLAGMKLARKLMKTDALKPYFDYEQYPGEKVQSDDELLQVAKERGQPLSTSWEHAAWARHLIRQR